MGQKKPREPVRDKVLLLRVALSCPPKKPGGLSRIQHRWFGVVGVVGLESFRATNAYSPGISGPGGKGVAGVSIPGGRSGPGGLQGPDGGVGDGDVGSACAMPIASPTALKPTPPATTAMATSCLSFSAHLPGLICVGLGVIIGTPGEMSRNRRRAPQKPRDRDPIASEIVSLERGDDLTWLINGSPTSVRRER